MAGPAAKMGRVQTRMTMVKLTAPLAVLAGIGVLVLGGPARGQTGASIVAKDFEFRAVPDAAATVTVTAGGTVGFSNSGGTGAPHNVRFTSAQPASCAQSVGTSSFSVPPLPSPATSAAWEGKCTFTTAGSYPFVCEVHADMTGTVTVTGATSPPPPSASPPPPGPPPPVSPPPPPSPATTGPAASLLRVSTPQRGFTVRGSVQVRSAGSRLLARAFARRGAVGGGRSTLLVQVGRQARASVGPGRVALAVSLSAAARRALRRSGRLAITFRLTVDPTSGSTTTARRLVILRAPYPPAPRVP